MPVTLTRAQYSQRQQILQNRLAKKHLPDVYAALQVEADHFISIIESDGIDKALAETHKPYINPAIGPAVNRLYQDAGEQAYSRFRVAKGIGTSITGFAASVLKYFEQYLFDLLVISVSDTVKASIRQAMNDGIENGWGIDKTVSKIKNEDLLKWQAKRIVRTETTRATNYSQLKAAENNKFQMDKQWIAVEDNRTRFGLMPGGHNHLGVDGERRDIYQDFSNGLLFPGDPDGEADQTINCRCTLGYFVRYDQTTNRPLLKPVEPEPVEP